MEPFTVRRELLNRYRIGYVCMECGKRYKYKHGLAQHEREQHADLEPKYSCQYCPYRAKRKYHLQSHSQLFIYSAVSILTNPFWCLGCGKRYRHRKTLKRHVRLECGKEPQFHCPLCPYRAKQNAHLTSHMISKHMSKLGLEAVCLSEVRQVLHAQVHAEEARGVGMRQRPSIPLPPMSLQGQAERFGCENCGKVYRNKPSLVRHLSYECGKEPMFWCSYCPYKAKRNSHLTSHVFNMHTPKQTLANFRSQQRPLLSTLKSAPFP
ncbi:hypothetical protein AAG570_013962 [Ranatra chinensis]|uniref:C2H2-type domain-containing protein n=1 Tax=Ranatra chinensis TaxID=642074 RepID=A0ABD0YDN8_9HEMI